MSKQMKKYCIIGKLICDTISSLLFITAFFGIPIIASGIAEYLTRLFIGG